MIALEEITLNEDRKREPVYLGSEPIGLTRGRTSRTVSIVLRVEDSDDISRIHAAVDALVNPPRTSAPAEDPYVTAYREQSRRVDVDQSLVRA